VAITTEQDGERKATINKGLARQKKNDENSTISPCKNIIFKKVP
jgi:hypothetical protein